MASIDPEFAQLLAYAETVIASQKADDSIVEAARFWDSDIGRSLRGANDDTPAGERDRPLSFHWKVDKDAVARTGYQLTGVDDDDRCMRSMMADLVLAGRAGEWVSYSRNQDFYRASGRYAGIPYAYGRIKLCVEILLQLRLINEDRKKPGAHRRKIKLQSRMRATPQLLAAFEDAAFEFDPVETIRLRDAKGRLVGYDENGKTIAMRRDMARLNTFVRSVTIELPDEDVVRRGDLLMVDGATVRTGPIFMHRSFCRSSFTHGGRIYWFGQNLPWSRRKHLLVDGKKVYEHDYASMHIRMLYAKRGVKLEHDPYEIAGVARAHAKLALLVVINARTRRQAICALLHATFKDGSRWPHDFAATSDLIDRIVARNPEIADDVCSDKGVRLMLDDSEIAIRVIKACMKKGIVCLPIHDSFIVQDDHKDALIAIMAAEMERYEAGFSSVKNVVVSSGNKTEIAVSSLTQGDGALPPLPAPPASVPVLPTRPVVPTPSSPARRGPRLLPAGRSWAPRKIDRTEYFQVDARGCPIYDRVEAARRLEVWKAALASNRWVEHFPVPGEREQFSFMHFGKGWKRRKEALYREALEGYQRSELLVPPQTDAERAANRRLPLSEGGSGWGVEKAVA